MPNNVNQGKRKNYSEKEPWEKTLDNMNRVDRRRDSVWRRRVVKIDANLMSEVTTNSRRVILDRLNALEPEWG